MSRGRPAVAVQIAALAAALLIAGFACNREYAPASQDVWKAGTRTHTISVDDDGRSYLLHVPVGRRRNRFDLPEPYPLVVVLHGSGADGETVREQSGMDRLADSLHFLAAYPNGSAMLFGLGSDWNAGVCCGSAARRGVDDLTFIDAVASDIEKHLPVDRRRIYVAGFSDGGRMAYHVACDASTMVAAIGVVSGSLVDDSCSPSRAVPLVAFHGTADTEVPYDDSIAAAMPRPPLAASAALPPSVRFWSALNRCQRLSVRRDAPHVLRAQFGPCAGADVLFFEIDSGGHAWPGGLPDGPGGFRPTTELSASDTMVRFFFRHPLR